MSKVELGDESAGPNISPASSNASATLGEASRPETVNGGSVPGSVTDVNSLPEGGLAAWATVAGAYVYLPSMVFRTEYMDVLIVSSSFLVQVCAFGCVLMEL